jgi:chemotaxis protein CheD
MEIPGSNPPGERDALRAEDTQFIGIGQMKISSTPNDLLVAPNLGSCVGVAIYDVAHGRAAMLHCLLPLSKTDPAKAAANPFLYVDTGVATLLQKLADAGSVLKELSIVAVGGANINDENNVFEIGKKNETVLRKILWKNGLLLRSEDFGGSFGRTLSLQVGTGKLTLKANGATREI